MKDINIYADINSWLDESPTAVIRGYVSSKNDTFVEIVDENGYTQLLNMTKLFAVVY